MPSSFSMKICLIESIQVCQGLECRQNLSWEGVHTSEPVEINMVLWHIPCLCLWLQIKFDPKSMNTLHFQMNTHQVVSRGREQRLLDNLGAHEAWAVLPALARPVHRVPQLEPGAKNQFCSLYMCTTASTCRGAPPARPPAPSSARYPPRSGNKTSFIQCVQLYCQSVTWFANRRLRQVSSSGSLFMIVTMI